MSAQIRSRSRSRARSRARSKSRVRNFRPLFSGQVRKEVSILKSESILGITVSDNANGYTYIRRIRPDSTCSKLQSELHVGDQIETINGESMLNKRHFQVARLLRNVPVGQFVKLGLITEFGRFVPTPPKCLAIEAPQQNQLAVQQPIIEFPSERAPLIIELPDDSNEKDEPSKKVVECINKIFEEYLGFDDDDLAKSIWKLASESKDLLEMSKRLRDSEELSQFQFPEEMIFDFWGIVDDHKNSRLNN